MQKKFSLYISSETDPFFNLALENQILLDLAPNEKAILVYKNIQSIVYGRFQNPWLECDLDKVKKTKTLLARRQSGGGCVYHDTGNLNFCFLYGEKKYYKEENNQFLCDLLKPFSIDAYLSDRSDILVKLEGDEFKISGSAFKQKKDRSFHHCTFLINADLTKLNSLLKTKLESISTKSTQSNPRPVINLKDINSKISEELLIEELKTICEKNGGLTHRVGSLKEQDYLIELKAWKWVFGETPLFQIKIELDALEVLVSARKGRIQEIEFKQNKELEFHPAYFEVFTEKLKGVPLIGSKLYEIMEKLSSEFSECTRFNNEFLEILGEKLSL